MKSGLKVSGKLVPDSWNSYFACPFAAAAALFLRQHVRIRAELSDGARDVILERINFLVNRVLSLRSSNKCEEIPSPDAPCQDSVSVEFLLLMLTRRGDASSMMYYLRKPFSTTNHIRLPDRHVLGPRSKMTAQRGRPLTPLSFQLAGPLI